MAGRKPVKQMSGGARMTASGRKPVTLWLTADEHATLRAAAARDRRPMTQFAIRAAMMAAEKMSK
jgi:uncharacterized protein (DUF1778 family)